jgi:hypothetical protein
MQQTTVDKKANCERYSFLNATSAVPAHDVDKNSLFRT